MGAYGAVWTESFEGAGSINYGHNLIIDFTVWYVRVIFMCVHVYVCGCLHDVWWGEGTSIISNFSWSQPQETRPTINDIWMKIRMIQE